VELKPNHSSWKMFGSAGLQLLTPNRLESSMFPLCSIVVLRRISNELEKRTDITLGMCLKWSSFFWSLDMNIPLCCKAQQWCPLLGDMCGFFRIFPSSLTSTSLQVSKSRWSQIIRFQFYSIVGLLNFFLNVVFFIFPGFRNIVVWGRWPSSRSTTNWNIMTQFSTQFISDLLNTNS